MDISLKDFESIIKDHVEIIQGEVSVDEPHYLNDEQKEDLERYQNNAFKDAMAKNIVDSDVIEVNREMWSGAINYKVVLKGNVFVIKPGHLKDLINDIRYKQI